MSDVIAELVHVRDAFSKPTLRLLHRKWAPLVLAVFRTSLTGTSALFMPIGCTSRSITTWTSLGSVGSRFPSALGVLRIAYNDLNDLSGTDGGLRLRCSGGARAHSGH